MQRKINQTRWLLLLFGVFLFNLQLTVAQSPQGSPQIDTSPHKSGFVTANGIKLHYLDWGGTGDFLLLLNGFSDNAHIFDEFAPKFTDRFHVIGMTRRGFGESEKPATGYDNRTLVEDIRAFLDAMKIKKANIVGHSMAGSEMTLFASLYPKRVRKLVYLDAAYDDTVGSRRAPDAPDIPPLPKRLILEALGSPEAEKVVVKTMPPPDVWERMTATIRGHLTYRPDYRKIRAPALAFYSTREHQIPPQTDEATRRKITDWYLENVDPFKRASIEQFRREARHGEVVEMKQATHYLFKGETADEVVRRTREFLLK